MILALPVEYLTSVVTIGLPLPAQAHMFRMESDWHTDRTLHGNRSGHSSVTGQGGSSGYGSSGHGGGNSTHSSAAAVGIGGGANGGGITSGSLMYSHNMAQYMQEGEIQEAGAAGDAGFGLPPTALQQAALFPSGRLVDQTQGVGVSGGSVAMLGAREGGAGQSIVRSNSEVFERDCEIGDSVRGGMRVIPSVGSAPVTAGGFSHEVRHLDEEGEGLPCALAEATPFGGGTRQ
jgi:hypothetical protein